MIDKVIKAVVTQPLTLEITEDDADEIDSFEDSVVNTVKITLMGAARWDAVDQKYKFSRSLDHVLKSTQPVTCLKMLTQRNLCVLFLSVAMDSTHAELGSYA